MGKLELLKLSFEFSPKLGIRKLPKLSARKESNIPGLYVVGDLADAPIIKVALNQGYEIACQVVAELVKERASSDTGVLDVVVIGAGPAGIGAALALQEAGLSYVVIEREKPFATIQNFPKAKLIFSEPHELENKGNFWFEDAKKEDLVERWNSALDERKLVLHQPEEVTDIQRKGRLLNVSTVVREGGRMGDYPAADVPTSLEAGAKNIYTARRVILAIGRRGSVRKMGVPGEDLEKVAYTLRDPAQHAGRKVVVFGGGDSAVEAAVSCAEAGAEVTISYRQDGFHRAKLKNQARINALIEAEVIRAELGTKPLEVTETSVLLERGGESIEVENDDVLVFFGTKLPEGFFRKIGLVMDGAMSLRRAAWIISFAFLTYLFYVIKKGKTFWPFGEGQLLGGVPDALSLDFGYIQVSGAFWGTALYTALIIVFGMQAYRKYPSRKQKIRYICLIGFQAIFLFGVPELLAPLVMEGGWKTYALTVPWPLWKEQILIGNPEWSGGGVDVLWMAAGIFVSAVVLPVLVWRQGERFCSYFCGCGGLAETFGDRWRHLAPRGKTAKQMEWFGVVILILTIPVTIMVALDFWDLGATHSSAQFADAWYTLIVDFMLASFLAVAFYPYLGNRFWCRFFCPLRALMQLMSKWFGKIAIKPNEKCIGCGECTRYCQMGINVQKYAQRQMTFHNGNSACIQCGICVQVCPMDVLSITERDFSIKENLKEW